MIICVISSLEIEKGASYLQPRNFMIYALQQATQTRCSICLSNNLPKEVHLL